MKNLLLIQNAKFIVLGLILASTVGFGISRSYCQVSLPDGSDPDSQTTLDQASDYPVQSQMAETPNLNRLNENADSMQYTDRTRLPAPLVLSVDTSGTWTSNLYNNYDNQPTTTGFYLNLGVPVGVSLSTPVTGFGAYFRDDTSFYPGHTDLNHSSQIYSHQLVHQISDATTTSWSLAAGHVVTLGRYLSPVISIGSTGVALPAQSGGMEPMYDAATSYSVMHHLNERDSLTVSGTAGWLDYPGETVNSSKIEPSDRQWTGGAVAHWQRALNSREIGGIEFTNVYIKGLSPVGSSNFTAVLFTFGQTLTPRFSFNGGIGPLFTHTSQGNSDTSSDLSYNANAGFKYLQAFGSINGGYSRIYQMGYLETAAVANQFYVGFDRQLTRVISLTADLQYLKTSTGASSASGQYSHFGYTASLDSHITRSLIYHIGASYYNQNTMTPGTPNPGYHDNEVSAGITYFFGNPLSRAGVR